MRTAVVRVNVDPTGVLTAAQLGDGMTTLLVLAEKAGAELVHITAAALQAGRREVELLVAGDDAETVKGIALGLCAKAFGTSPVASVVTYISRGTDDDAHGVLAGFGLTGEIRRTPGDDDGFDVVYVTLRQADLDRVPESRIPTALAASLNCEVHILTE